MERLRSGPIYSTICPLFPPVESTSAGPYIFIPIVADLVEHLNPEERKTAAVLYQALKLAQQLWSQGEKDSGRIRLEMTELIQKQPLTNIDYISVADALTLEELSEIKPPALVSLAVKIGKPRLIDNIVLE